MVTVLFALSSMSLFAGATSKPTHDVAQVLGDVDAHGADAAGA